MNVTKVQIKKLGEMIIINKLKRKHIVFLVVFIIFITMALPVSSTNFSSKLLLKNKSFLSEDSIEISVEKAYDKIMINYKLNDFAMIDLEIDGKVYKKIVLGDESHLKIKGEPELPNICRSIIIPNNKIMDIKVVNTEFKDFENVLVAPSKGVINRDTLYKNIPYEFSNSYENDDYYPLNIAELDTPYNIRNFRGQVVKVNPFQYNPIKKILRFYTDISVEIFSIGNAEINSIKSSEPIQTIDSDFNSIYEKHFINYDLSFYDPVEEQGNMIVITYDDFWDAMIPFVQWKNMKGIPTDMINVSDIGNAYDIKNYISEYYYNNGLTFVLLVGDAQQVPTLYASGGASDPSYSYVVGDDHYPDLFVGRFSAQDISQVETQVQRSIDYEKYPQVGADWYQKGTGIASNQGPGDDGEFDDEHIDYIRDDLLGYAYTVVDQIYDPYGSSSDVTNSLNDGRSIINYCGHGWPEGWGSSGFSSSDIDALINYNKLPFIWSVACNNGEFDSYNTCFAEAWLRATNNEGPTGAIAAFMSSISQSWDPPMDAQDEFNDLLTTEGKATFGGLSYNGCMHMNDEYGVYGWEITDTWILFGDPSIQVRTNTPENLVVTNEPIILMGSLLFEIDVEGVEGALCAISRQNELLGYGYTDSLGHAIVEFSQPITPGDNLDLVVTAQNMIPYFGSLIVEGESDFPGKPDKPDGSKIGSPGEEYSFSSKAEDPDNDQIYYMWDWGDGNFSIWLGPYDSGEICSETYTWTEKGLYSVRVKAKDIYGLESEWSDPLEVTMPKGKIVTFLINFIERFFPRLYSLLSN